MSNSVQNNKRIAKNTMFLYFRMLILMLVSLYTSRVVLSALGVVDYGIYNVVGGVVTLFTFVNGGMISATQRYMHRRIGRYQRPILSWSESSISLRNVAHTVATPPYSGNRSYVHPVQFPVQTPSERRGPRVPAGSIERGNCRRDHEYRYIQQSFLPEDVPAPTYQSRNVPQNGIVRLPDFARDGLLQVLS